MKDLVEFAELLRTRLLAEGHTCAVLWGRDEAKRHDNQGPGTANRVVVYDGAPDDPKGQWVRHATTTNTHVLENREKLARWQRVTIDVWGYCPSPATVTLDGGTEEAGQFRAKDYLSEAVGRSAYDVVRSQGHKSTILQETWNNRTTPTGRRHGDRSILSFEIEFASRAPIPTTADFVECEPKITGVAETPYSTVTEVTP